MRSAIFFNTIATRILRRLDIKIEKVWKDKRINVDVEKFYWKY